MPTPTVVAKSPMESFAYGVVVPIPTRLVLVPKRIKPPSVSRKVKSLSEPPAPPPAAAQVRLPEASVFKKFPLTIVEGQV